MEACGGQVVMTDCVEYPCFAIVEGDVAGCGATEGLEGVVTSWVPCPDGEDVAIQVLLGDLQSAVVHAQPEGGMFEFLPDLARIGGRRLDDAVYASLDRCR
jgi:hypothetical protein